MRGTFARNQVVLAEETVDRAKISDRNTGTVQSVDATAMTAQVRFADGSAGSITCQVPSHVVCVANDRVAVDLYGSQWVVTATLGVLRGLGEGGVSQGASSGTAPVGSWGNLPGTPAFTFTKVWAGSRVFWQTSVGCFTTVLGSTIQFGITYNGGSTTIKTGQYTFANNGGDPALDAHDSTWWTYETGLAAGTYTVRLRWQSDANVQSTSADDWVSGRGKEVP